MPPSQRTLGILWNTFAVPPCLPQNFAMSSGYKLFWPIKYTQGHAQERQPCYTIYLASIKRNRRELMLLWQLSRGFTIPPWRYINHQCLGVWLNLQTGHPGLYFIFCLYLVAVRPHQCHPFSCSVVLLSVWMCPNSIKSNSLMHCTLCVVTKWGIYCFLFFTHAFLITMLYPGFLSHLKFCCRLVYVHI